MIGQNYKIIIMICADKFFTCHRILNDTAALISLRDTAALMT